LSEALLTEKEWLLDVSKKGVEFIPDGGYPPRLSLISDFLNTYH